MVLACPEISTLSPFSDNFQNALFFLDIWWELKSFLPVFSAQNGARAQCAEPVTGSSSIRQLGKATYTKIECRIFRSGCHYQISVRWYFHQRKMRLHFSYLFFHFSIMQVSIQKPALYNSEELHQWLFNSGRYLIFQECNRKIHNYPCSVFLYFQFTCFRWKPDPLHHSLQSCLIRIMWCRQSSMTTKLHFCFGSEIFLYGQSWQGKRCVWKDSFPLPCFASIPYEVHYRECRHRRITFEWFCG